MLYPGWVPADELWAIIMIMGMVLLVPAILVVYEVHKAGDRDYTLRSRKKRLMPLAIQSIMLLSASAASLGLLHLDFEALRFILLLNALVVVLWLITYKWKISFHMAGTTFLALHIWLEPPFVYGNYLLLLLTAIPLLAAWARWRLHVHTPEQLLAGFGLGMAVACCVIFIS